MKKLTRLGIACVIISGTMSCASCGGDVPSGRQVGKQAGPNSSTTPTAKKTKPDVRRIIACGKDWKPPVLEKSPKNRVISRCRFLTAVEAEEGAENFQVSMWQDGFEAISSSAMPGGAMDFAIRRFNAKGKETGGSFWRMPRMSDERMFVPGQGMTLLIAPETKESGGENLDKWHLSCVKGGEPEGSFVIKGRDPRAAWQRGRFIVIYRDGSEMLSLVSDRKCRFSKSKPKSVGEAIPIMAGVPHPKERGPFATELVASGYSLGILIVAANGEKILKPRLVTLKLNHAGDALQPLKRVPFYENPFSVEGMDGTLFSGAENGYFVGIMDRETRESRGKKFVTYNFLSPAGRVVSLTTQSEVAGFWKGGWIIGGYTDRGYAFRYSEDSVSDPVIVSDQSTDVRGNGKGLFVMEGGGRPGVCPRGANGRYTPAPPTVAGRDPGSGSPSRFALVSCR